MIKNITPAVYDTLRLQLLTHTTQPVPADGRNCWIETDALSADMITHCLMSAAEAGCKKLQIVGGDPMLSPLLETTLEKAEEHGFCDIALLSPLVLLPAQSLEALEGHSVRLVSWFYSDQPFVHEQITGDLNSWTAIIRNLETCLRSDINFKLWVPCLEASEETLEETVLFLQDTGFEHVQIISEFSANALLATRPFKPHLLIEANGNAILAIRQSHILMGNLHKDALPDLLFPKHKDSSTTHSRKQEKIL